jgi:hypothetical protein
MTQAVNHEGFVDLYDSDWTLAGRVFMGREAIAEGKRIKLPGRGEFQIFEVTHFAHAGERIDELSASAAPPHLLPRHITYPWMRAQIRDLIAVALSTAEERRAFSHGFGEWVNQLDDIVPTGGADAVGVALESAAEGAAVQSFLTIRDAMLGQCADFDDLEAHYMWPRLQAAATVAVEALPPYDA